MTSPCVVLHCLRGKESVEKISLHAKRLGLNISSCKNENGLQISCDEKKSSGNSDNNNSDEDIEKFIRIYQNDPNVAVLYNHDDPRNGKLVKYKSHCRVDDSKSSLPRSSTTTSLMTAGDGRTTSTMAKYYNFPNVSSSTVGKSTTTRPTIAVISLGGSYRQSDLDAYWKLLGFVGADIPVVTSIAVVASNNPAFTGSGEDLENTLDLEIVGGICRGSNIRFYKTPNTDLGFYQAIDTAINGVSGVPPNVISISWGAPELYYSSVTLSAMDQLFALAKSKGIIVCAASGDDGSSDGVSDNMLHVDFPASSSNVLACGGTSLVNPLVETGWSWNTSSKSGGGGGQSSVFKRPAYQVITSSSGTDPTLIPSTVTLGSGTNGATANTVNLVNRTVPDISLNADPKSGWSIFFNGKLLTNSIGGTSCVAPCVAGYFASLRLPTSITSLIHENIYQIYCSKSLSAMFSCPFSSSSTGTLSTPTVKPTRGPFKDITIGNNDSISALTNAYSSAVNYDCVTGIGSFDGSLLFAALSSLTVRSQQKTNNTSSELKKIDRDIDKMDKKQKVLQTTQLKNRGELEEIFMEIEEEQILEEILDQNGFPAISETIKKRLAEKKEEVKVEKVKVEKVKVEKKVEKQKKEKKKGIFSKLFK